MGITNNAVNLILRGEPFINFCHSFYDLFVETNVDFRQRVGLRQIIIRRQVGKCCDWCANLAGIYYADDAPPNIYQRHDSCKCMLTSTTEKDTKKYIDLWSKKKYETQKEARIERIKEIENNIKSQKKKTPRNPKTGIMYKYHEIKFTDEQFGSKIGKHAKDFGMDPSIKKNRNWFKKYIKDIVKHAEERVYLTWKGQEELVIAHIFHDDVVLEDADGCFITIMKMGARNGNIIRGKNTE